MRLSCAIFIGAALLSGGCTTVPTVVGISGLDSVPLNTRQQIHDALGEPISAGMNGDTTFEEFQVKNGCNQNILGYRVPAFQPLEEFHIVGSGELRLIAVKDYSCIPTHGKNLIVVASIEDVLHFRIFDQAGNMVVDTDEKKLSAKAGRIAELKNRLENLWAPHKLTDEERNQIITAVTSIVGHIPLGSFEIGVAKVKYYGLLLNAISLPTPTENDLGKQRVFRGQILRFDYDKTETVTKVCVDGEFVLTPIKNPLTAPTVTAAYMQH
jgi:hypothetical protein